MYATTEDYQGSIPNVVTNLGPLESSGNSLTNTFQIKGIFNNWGAALTGTMDVAKLVPTISFHGDADTTVPIDNSREGLEGSNVIHDLLEQNAICNDYTVELGGGHGIYRDAAGTQFRINRTACFFKSILCDTCTDFYAEEQVDRVCD